ncbi:MAG TPA: PH domain-containing protein [Rhizobiaceae bacterium]|nr:PH domain-containing protein [Rhizobiaceae bacterium]
MAGILAPGERVEHAYQLIRAYFVFTDKRLALVDKQGLTGRKLAYHSIPYESIVHFSVETAGTFDLDAQLMIWISGTADPIQKQFNKKLCIYEVQAETRPHRFNFENAAAIAPSTGAEAGARFGLP